MSTGAEGTSSGQSQRVPRGVISPAAEERRAQRGRSSVHRSRFLRVWITLLAIALVAVGILILLWLTTTPKPNELTYEVAKTCLQVIGLTVIGGILTAATASAQQTRQDDAEALERQREEFKVRTSLLDRSTRCAQEMFITCQHVKRVKKAPGVDDPKGLAVPQARELLDRTYLEFSTESVAIETELGARFGELRVERGGSGEAFLRWHQIRDLLTVYYFALCEGFPGRVLERNSKDYKCKMHSGVDFEPLVADPDRPSPAEVKRVIDELREAFWKAMPKFAEAVLRDEIRDL